MALPDWNSVYLREANGILVKRGWPLPHSHHCSCAIRQRRCPALTPAKSFCPYRIGLPKTRRDLANILGAACPERGDE